LGVLLHKGIAQNIDTQGAVGHGFFDDFVECVTRFHFVGAAHRWAVCQYQSR
jgi:hypothetical protein